MPGPTILQEAGSRPPKQLRYAPIFTNRFFTGLWTQRNPLRDPSDRVSEKFYGGRPDALIGGSNIELTNRLTLARRPGLVQYSSASLGSAPDSFYMFRQWTGNTTNFILMVDTATTVYSLTSTTATSVFTKSAGAGQAFFQGVGSFLYFGDGVDTEKWDGTKTWNWGIVAPAKAPSVTSTPSGSAAATWQANTVFSTMGLLVDSNSNMQFLSAIIVNNAPATLGSTGSGQPGWVTPSISGTTTTDNTVPWMSFGQITQWQASHTYAARSTIYDPVSGALFTSSTSSGTSGTSKPNFVNRPVDANGNLTTFSDGTVLWACDGPPILWQASHTYAAWWEHPTAFCCEPVLATAANTASTTTQPVYFQVVNTCNEAFPISTGACATTGVSAASYAAQWGTTPGQTTYDGNLIWVALTNGPNSSAAWAATTNYTGWTPGSATFSAIKDSNNNFQVCITSGQSGGGAPTWGTIYGSTTNDGSAKWVMVGPAGPAWAANTQWYLPTGGYAPPSAAQTYGGAQIVANSDVQVCIQSGESGGSAPAWGAVGTNTTDNGIIWYTASVASTSSLVWTKGYEYAYAYKARSSTDTYSQSVNTAFGAGTALNSAALGPPTGSASGGVSTASPIFTITGGNTGAVNTVSGIGSTDPQVDTIEIYRTLDGGATLFFLTDIANPALNADGTARTWTFNDTIPDSQLNTLIEAPVGHVNDPPLSGLINLTYHFGRVWGSVGQTVYASGGPDTSPGNGAEAFPPANFWAFPSTVTRLVPTSTGLIVFTTSDIFIIAGGPAITTFFSNVMLPGYGLLSYNALDINGGIIYFFSSASQMLGMDPSAGLSEIGFAIGDQLLSVSPSNAYVTFHIGGSTDTALYIADGSTGWYRCNPNQAPEGGAVWSPKATIVGGCKAVQSIETSAGVHQLLVGPTGAGHVLNRSLSTFTDNGTAYDATFTMGSLILAQPGQLAELAFITTDFTATGSQPTVKFLLDEISGAFTSFPSSVPDPPQLTASSTVYGNRYYFSQTSAPAWCRHMQISVDYGNTDTVQNELLSITIFGAHWQEK